MVIELNCLLFVVMVSDYLNYRTSDESVRTIRTLYIENLQKVLFYVIMYLARELA